jgi:hypothetical protein
MTKHVPQIPAEKFMVKLSSALLRFSLVEVVHVQLSYWMRACRMKEEKLECLK